MRKIIAMIISFALILSLCACGAPPSESSTRDYNAPMSQCECCCCTNH